MYTSYLLYRRCIQDTPSRRARARAKVSCIQVSTHSSFKFEPLLLAKRACCFPTYFYSQCNLLSISIPILFFIKLKNDGVGGNILDNIRYFLSCTTCTVLHSWLLFFYIIGSFWGFRGSDLGPLLFVLYINERQTKFKMLLSYLQMFYN